MAKGTPNDGINGTLSNGLIAHYSFNDGSLADLSGNGYDLTQVGTVNNTTDKDGQTGQAKEILAIGNYLTTEPKYFGTGANRAISIWVYIPSLTSLGSILSIGSEETSTGPYLLIQQSNNTIKVYRGGGYSAGVSITVGWHNIIYNKNKLYIDKILVTTHNSFEMDSFPYLYLFTGYPHGIVCKLDEVRVYNRPLTGDRTTIGETATGEIAEIFTMGANYEVDVTPPTFNTINTSNITSSSVDLNINCSENATAYYKLYDRNATAPTPAELKAAHDKTIALTANNLVTENITVLTALKDYDLYVVAEDTVGNLQALPTKIAFSTTEDIGKGTPNEGINGTLGNGLVLHCSFNDGIIQDISGNGNYIGSPGIPELGVDKDGRAGQAVIVNDTNYISALVLSLVGSEYISGSFIFKASSEYTPIMAFASDLDSPKSAFYVMSNGNLGIYNAKLWSVDTGINVLDNKYHHLVFVANTSGTHLYLDKKYIDKFVRIIDNNESLIYFGRLDFCSGDSNIDEIRFYNRRLTGETLVVNQEPTLEIAEIFDMGANYTSNAKPKISEIIFNIDFDKVQLGTYIEIKYLDIKANGVSILDKKPIVKYWSIYSTTPRVLDKEGEMFGNSSTDWYFQAECDGYEPSDIIRKDLKIISIDGYQGDYSGGSSGGSVNYAYHNNDNYKTSEARILIPLTNNSFISYKK